MAFRPATGSGGIPIPTTAAVVRYVNDATGNDANDGLTALTPFKTIQKGIDDVCTNIGTLRVEIAAGTYVETLLIPTFGTGELELRGDQAVPGNVVVDFGANLAGIQQGANLPGGALSVEPNNAALILDGLELQNGFIGLFANKSRAIVRHVDFVDQALNAVLSTDFGLVYFEQNANGAATITQAAGTGTAAISSGNQGSLLLDQDMTISGFKYGVECQNSTTLNIPDSVAAPPGTFTVTLPNVAGAQGIRIRNGCDAILSRTLDITGNNNTDVGLYVSQSTVFHNDAAGASWDFTDCDIGIQMADTSSMDLEACTMTYTNCTVDAQISPSSTYKHDNDLDTTPTWLLDTNEEGRNFHHEDDISGTYGGTEAAPNVSTDWDTADANANMMKIDVPAGDATDIPGVMVGVGIKGVDLGILDGETEPFIGAMKADRTESVRLTYSDDSAIMASATGIGIRTENPNKLVLSSGADQVFCYPNVDDRAIRFIFRASSNSKNCGFELGEPNASTFFMRAMQNYDEALYAGSSNTGRQFLFMDQSNRDRDHDIPVMANPIVGVYSILNPNTDHSEVATLAYQGLRCGEVDNADWVSSSFEMETDRATYDFTVGAVSANSGAAVNTTGGNLILKAGDGVTAADNGDIQIDHHLVMNSRRIQGAKGADVASANDMTLGLDGNYFDITGATQINGIAVANWQAGSQITLQFDSTPTVKHNTAAGAGFASFLLAGAADFVATANDTLTLIYDSVTWREVARAVI